MRDCFAVTFEEKVFKSYKEMDNWILFTQKMHELNLVFNFNRFSCPPLKRIIYSIYKLQCDLHGENINKQTVGQTSNRCAASKQPHLNGLNNGHSCCSCCFLLEVKMWFRFIFVRLFIESGTFFSRFIWPNMVKSPSKNFFWTFAFPFCFGRK